MQDYQAKNQDLAQVEASADRLEDYLGEYRNTTNPADPATRIYLEFGHAVRGKNRAARGPAVPGGRGRFAHLFFYGGEQLRIQFLRDGSGQVTGAEAVVTAEAFGLALSYHLDPVKSSSSPLLWILAAVVGVGLAAAGVFLRLRKLRQGDVMPQIKMLL